MATKEWYDWWLSEDSHGDTLEDVSQSTWDAAIKFINEKSSSDSDYEKCGCGSTENTDVYCEKCLTKIAEQGN